MKSLVVKIQRPSTQCTRSLFIRIRIGRICEEELWQTDFLQAAIQSNIEDMTDIRYR